MPNGYWVLVWDGYGSGLVLCNARLHSEGLDIYGNPRNWWPCAEETTAEEIAEKLRLDELYGHYRIIIDK